MFFAFRFFFCNSDFSSSVCALVWVVLDLFITSYFHISPFPFRIVSLNLCIIFFLLTRILSYSFSVRIFYDIAIIIYDRQWNIIYFRDTVIYIVFTLDRRLSKRCFFKFIGIKNILRKTVMIWSYSKCRTLLKI